MMSFIGEFALIKKKSLHLFLNSIENNADETADYINAIIEEVEASSDLLYNNECSGEVYMAIFEYFEQKKGIDIRGQSNYGEIWREITEDFDVIIMTAELAKQMVIEPTDYSSFCDFLNDLYQMNFGEMAEIALRAFESILEKLSNENAVLFRLY